ncbi:prepilin peptidase [Prosthecomicrobium sp. N25]|uniref:prepilin peptidase n=1 Tax=Prosthecomicrobium sp. N25 TaxID=3129254 RepID=UPI0030769DB2
MAEAGTRGKPGGRGAWVAAGGLGALAAAALADPGEAGFAIVLWALVLVVVASDLADYTIPDLASAAIAAVGLLRAAVLLPGGETVRDAVVLAALQGLGALAAFWAVRAVHMRLAGREGLGFGDVKLAGALGVWLDWGAQALALQAAAVAALAAVLVARRRGAPGGRDLAVPLGAFLAPAAFAVHLLLPYLDALP